ncbi:unnamed protein product [Ambrosiozyma monospora]|uniref:Unnamed protein product n=1 Tax=Ambrosiozyma monospora TaxID=43982 RepID=A0ACB5U1U4_AMBMO|nr:unnamed protein product [Ambrosiozyma monospora]
MDLVQAPKRQDVFDVMRGRVDAAASSFNMTAVSFPTSIWDESLYKAWSKIVCSLIPNLQKYQEALEKANKVFEAKEIILLEKTTALVIASTVMEKSYDGNEWKYGRKKLDKERYGKVSTLIKTHKQSCNKLRTNFRTHVLQSPTTSTYIDVLTPTVYIVVVKCNRDEETGAFIDEKDIIMKNIRFAKTVFEKII